MNFDMFSSGKLPGGDQDMVEYVARSPRLTTSRGAGMMDIYHAYILTTFLVR